MNDSFCVLPFYGIEYSPSGITTTTPCCLLPDYTDITKLQQDILKGHRSSTCQKCWSLEDQGQSSNRQIQNVAFDFYADRDIEFIKEDCANNKFSTQIVKLYTSTTCNSTCVTCGPSASSAWGTLKNLKIHYQLPNDIIDNLDYANIKMLSFVGGEPLYEKRNFTVLERLIDANNTNCFISLTINGSVTLTERQLTILMQFKNLNFCLSIDGVGPVFEYMRYPLKWDTLLNNIKIYQKMNINLSVSYTISNLNVLYYQETIDWFNQMQLPYQHNIVSNPMYFSPGVLPSKIKELYPNLVEFTNKNLSHLLPLTYKEIQLQDQLKGISIKDYLPMLSKVLDEAMMSSN